MPLGKLLELSLIHNKKSHVLLKLSKKLQKKLLKKQEASESISLSGSLTVEAALIFPLFLFVLITLLSFFRIVQVSHITYSVLVSTASHFSLQSQDYPETEIHGFFVQKLGKENCSFIQGKEEGIQWQEIGIYGEYLQLQITYECKLPVNIFSIKSIPVSQGIRIKKWRGFEKKDQENTEGIWVYVTPSREVYHKTEDCTHLKLSIQTMECEKVLQEGYTPCIRCIKSGKKEAVYYITEEGRRYHSTLSCSGLKRTVYKVKYEEVSDLKECQRCGGIW